MADEKEEIATLVCCPINSYYLMSFSHNCASHCTNAPPVNSRSWKIPGGAKPPVFHLGQLDNNRIG